VDDLGRVVIPKELRNTLGIGSGSPLEIFTEGEAVMLRRYEPLCVFCGGGGPLVEHHNKRVCKACRAHLGAAG
jgi:transcriptional pleiotropic regulator of transition state genes